MVVLDNLCNSSAESITQAAQLAGRVPEFVESDIRHTALLVRLFDERSFSAFERESKVETVWRHCQFLLRCKSTQFHIGMVIVI